MPKLEFTFSTRPAPEEPRELNFAEPTPLAGAPPTAASGASAEEDRPLYLDPEMREPQHGRPGTITGFARDPGAAPPTRAPGCPESLNPPSPQARAA